MSAVEAQLRQAGDTYRDILVKVLFSFFNFLCYFYFLVGGTSI